MAAPVVVSTTPVDGATAALINAAISFQFDVALDTDSVTIQSFYVYDRYTVEEVQGAVSVSSNGKTITFTPARALFENRMYIAVAAGLSSGSGNYILSATGDPLADDYQIEFRTAAERYVPLSEAVERNDADYIAPIRAVESTLPPGTVATALTPLALSTSSPVSFATNQDRCISTITLTFSDAINPTGALDAVSLETFNVLGMDEYYAAPDGTGVIHLQDIVDRCSLTFEAPNTAPDYTQPTGEFSVSGNQIIWTRGVSEPCFNYNTEVQITVTTDLQSTSGASLGSESAVIFTTQFWPLFVGSRLVRTELGPVGRAFMDDTINRVIHRWSLDAMEQAAYQFNPDIPYPAVRRYVLYRTIITLIDDLVTQYAINGNAKKVLGDLEIQYGAIDALTKIPIYQRAQQSLKILTAELRRYRGQTRAQGFIKGLSSYDARSDLRERTWDNISLRHLWDMTPAANSVSERARRLLGAMDHMDNSANVPTTIYAKGPNGGGLFTAPRRSS